MTHPALDITDLHVQLPEARTGRLTEIVRGADVRIQPGQAVALVGASGCGKTTLARAAMRLVPASSGSITVDGRDITHLRGRALRRVRRHMQMVFQDPGGSLNGRMRVSELVMEPLLVHDVADREAARARAFELLVRCGLDDDAADHWPHQFSGGQRQRIAIARALATDPLLLVCDEPTSALDVSVQARVLNLLADLQEERQLAMLFITHDLAVARRVCSEVIVMDRGRVVERGAIDRVLDAPEHDVTRALVDASLEGSPHVGCGR